MYGVRMVSLGTRMGKAKYLIDDVPISALNLLAEPSRWGITGVRAATCDSPRADDVRGAQNLVSFRLPQPSASALHAA